uniref:Protein krueppel n=1 Tax=Clastoptera arizonana TaxID=38151 RepID=A0A1B6DHH9_9HEMI
MENVVNEGIVYETEEFCRLCASESKNGVEIYSPEGHKQCLEEKINYCLRISVSKTDLLPKHVCNFCYTRLEDWHRFADEANKVQHTLELLVQMKSFSNNSSEDYIDLPLNNQMEVKEENTVQLLSSQNLISVSSENLMESFLLHKTMVDDIKDSKIVDECFEKNKLLSNSFQSNDTRKGNAEKERRKTKTEPNIRTKNKINKRKNKKVLNTSESEESSNAVVDSNDDSKGFQDENVKDEVQNRLGIKCNECNIIIPVKSLFDEHYQSSYNKKPLYTCSFCDKTIEKYSTFRSHRYRHYTEGRYRCEICNKGFNLKNLLDLHITAKHTEIKPFICESCGKGFVTQSALDTHIKGHNHKEEYPCKECGKILYTKGGLTAHTNIHKLGRRFMCDLCGKTFSQKVNMQNHVKLHNNDRPYHCEKCGKSFAEKSHLNRHYIYHSEKRPFKCLICSKMYKTERCLKIHNLIHSENRPFICTYCNKGFLSVTKLKQHCNIHTGERPYKCKYCDRTFTNYPNWLKHIRRRHKVDHKTGMSIEVKEQTAESKNILPANNSFNICENNDINISNVIGPEVRQMTQQALNFSFLNQMYSDQNFMSNILLSSHMLPL